MEKDTKNWIIALLFIFVILLVGAFLIKPAATGYAIYQEMDKSNISIEDYQRGIVDFNAEIFTLNEELTACYDSKDTLLNDVKDISKRFAVCSEDLKSMEKQKEGIKEDYDLIIQNAANNICCKQRIDNPSIDSYSVKDSRIICSTDGDKKISCVF